jgi:cytochrome subunit of sulfide dehydrogenase
MTTRERAFGLKRAAGFGFAIAAALAIVPAAAQAEISRGAIIASTCFTCHGTDGISAGIMPSIYGRPAESMIEAMQGFRNGLRAATVMDRHASGYTDEEIVELAQYLSRVTK